MRGAKVSKGLQGSEDFDEALREEIQISYEFGLTLCVLSIRLPDGPNAETTRRLLSELRIADLAVAISSDELAVILPNTSLDNPRIVVERLISAVPEVEINEAYYELGDTPETLIERARQARRSNTD